MELADFAADVISIFSCKSISHFWNALRVYRPALIIPFIWWKWIVWTVKTARRQSQVVFSLSPSLSLHLSLSADLLAKAAGGTEV